jgi:hypothetical protein
LGWFVTIAWVLKWYLAIFSTKIGIAGNRHNVRCTCPMCAGLGDVCGRQCKLGHFIWRTTRATHPKSLRNENKHLQFYRNAVKSVYTGTVFAKKGICKKPRSLKSLFLFSVFQKFFASNYLRESPRFIFLDYC